MEYKMVFTPNIAGPTVFEQEFETLQEANAALDAIANYTLMLHDEDFMPDYSNYGTVMWLDGGTWCEAEAV